MGGGIFDEVLVYSTQRKVHLSKNRKGKKMHSYFVLPLNR